MMLFVECDRLTNVNAFYPTLVSEYYKYFSDHGSSSPSNINQMMDPDAGFIYTHFSEF